MKFTGQPRRAFFVYTLTAALVGSLGAASLAAPAPGQGTAAGPKAAPAREVATFAAGCFWSMEAIFKQLKGVEKAEPGYAGGKVAKPSYEQVETGTTGHAESVNIVFDPKVITYRDLLGVLLTVRNPTTPNKQGPDEGPQYRSIIFYRNEAQHKAATDVIQKFTKEHVWPNPIVTEVAPFTNFFRAEDYHFNYYNLHPDERYCRYVIAPEIAEFRAKFKSRLKN
ncbi:MAG: peptide methionine sulfoxide reductase [Chthonomonadaceae bacterium]|nr:peptide methionine sulfoxide reductase [Chthonomonadaceae bacterium]